MARSLAIALVLLLAGCATSMRESPRVVVDRFVAAFNHLDANELRSLFAENATAFLPMPQHAERVSGAEAILAILDPLLKADRERRHGEPLKLEAKELAIQERGDVAIATFDVGTADVHSRRTLVMERQGGKWRIIHLHASNVRP